MHTDVEELEERLRSAMLAGDVAELDRLIADELVFVGPDGSLATKADDLAAHRAGVVRFTKLVPSERRIQVHGDIAVVIVRISLACVFHGTPVEGDFRYTRIWKGGRIVAGHVSAIAPR